MKPLFPYCIVFLMVSGVAFNGFCQENVTRDAMTEAPDSVVASPIFIPDPETVFEEMLQPAVNNKIVNLSFVPKVFAGYRALHKLPEYSKREFFTGFAGPARELPDTTALAVVADSIPVSPSLLSPAELIDENGEAEVVNVPEMNLPNILTYERPQWFQDALVTRRLQEDLEYSYMIDHPMAIEYAYWDLPEPPVLLVEDRSFMGFINKQVVPVANAEEAVIPEVEVRKIHWLHKVGTQLQFSQAYVSPNWYQGGNSYLSLLFGFNWNVQLNQVYHPNILFQSDLSYKLALSSNPKGYYHRYTLSEDNFQYNLNAGLKAAKDWYYSLNLQFKTQLLNNYEQDSDVRTASFLSPGDLNIGLGMSYNHKNKLNTFSYTLTISPLSYNLKTCISDKIDHATYNIAPDKKTKSEIGSNLEFNMNWNVTTNISYQTKVFMFTDYHYYLADWQNTISFQINKFLSTQVFVHLRYDGSTENYGDWKKFMFREILSFGLSYTFSTKP